MVFHADPLPSGAYPARVPGMHRISVSHCRHGAGPVFAEVLTFWGQSAFVAYGVFVNTFPVYNSVLHSAHVSLN
jgi:hypothetical protein